MTSEEDGILIEDVGLPPKIKPEKLPEGLNETLLTMDVGNSFFLQTDNDQHSARKIGALRERIKRFGINTQNESTRSGRKKKVSGYTG